MAFFEKGADIQYRSLTVEQANKNYEKSCNICCSLGFRMRCERCPIEGAHNLVVSTLKKLEHDDSAPAIA